MSWVEWLARDERIDNVWGGIIVAALMMSFGVVAVAILRDEDWATATQAGLGFSALLIAILNRP